METNKYEEFTHLHYFSKFDIKILSILFSHPIISKLLEDEKANLYYNDDEEELHLSWNSKSILIANESIYYMNFHRILNLINLSSYFNE